MAPALPGSREVPGGVTRGVRATAPHLPKPSQSRITTRELSTGKRFPQQAARGDGKAF